MTALPIPTTSGVECPNCGKHTIVPDGGEYRCISCDFRRNFNPPPSKPNSFGNVVTTLLVLLLFLILM